jgi:hypothetical protein
MAEGDVRGNFVWGWTQGVIRGGTLALGPGIAGYTKVAAVFGTNCDRLTALHIATDWLRRGGDRVRPDAGPS